MVDGIGARLAGNPNAYSLWLFVGIAVVMLPYALYRDGRDVIPAMQTYWRRGFAGGALQVLSYGIAIWAMTVAPIAIVATLRETSVLFGAVIAVVVLKEPLRAVRIVAALLIVCGLVLIRCNSRVRAQLRIFALQPRQIAFGIDVPERGKFGQ